MGAYQIQAPNKIPKKVFLAGSIEMGKADNWQVKILDFLKGKEEEYIVLNPRRDDWDSSWEQKMTNPQFNEQVTWELNALDSSDIIIMYFDPNTMSPISLLELGLHASSHKMIVCCPEGFWRKGNVDIVCDRYNIPVSGDIESLMLNWDFLVWKLNN